MSPALRRLVLALALPPVLGGCTAMAVGGAVVGAGVTVASTAVGAGVAVGKGAATVVSAPFRSNDK
jgi:F0F1-type ATP synthase membrane subunit c/vacuolar-type H+-ATPase subunit K